MDRSLPLVRQHPFRRRSRFTLKADPERSFQAQTGDGNLIDIVPRLEEHGITLPRLRAGMHAGTGSQPMTIPTAAAEAVGQAFKRASVILTGPQLRKLRLDHPDLASPLPAEDPRPTRP